MTREILKRIYLCGKSLILFTGLMFSSTFVNANLLIEITRGVDNPTRIAVVPFAHSGIPIADNISSIVSADLQRSGRFKLLPPGEMMSSPSTSKEVFFRDWRALNVEYLLIGRSENVADKISVVYELFDINLQRSMLVQRVSNRTNRLRAIAHAISDTVFEKLTGVPGDFSTSLMYVSVTGTPPDNQTFRLLIADADGANPKEVLRSKEPILSPAWSSDGKQIAYVSFESQRPAIYRQTLATGQRERLTRFSGLNGAPSWSPDNKKLAMVLSKDGNPEIYVMDIVSRKLTRITNNIAIDTEPDWMPDGKSLIFTSDRGGSPQIYRVNLSDRKVKRLTFDGIYNAGAEVLSDGKSLVMVHRGKKDFHIAWQEIDSGRMIILTHAGLDESPSLSPNGNMLLYATKYKGKGVLAAVALDGGFKYRLPSPNSDVREPAWSP